MSDSEKRELTPEERYEVGFKAVTDIIGTHGSTVELVMPKTEFERSFKAAKEGLEELPPREPSPAAKMAAQLRLEDIEKHDKKGAPSPVRVFRVNSTYETPDGKKHSKGLSVINVPADRFFHKELDKVHMSNRDVPTFPGVHAAGDVVKPKDKSVAPYVRVFLSRDEVNVAEQLLKVAGKSQESVSLSNTLGDQTKVVHENARSVAWSGSVGQVDEEGKALKGSDGKTLKEEVSLSGIEALERISKLSATKSLVQVKVDLMDVLEHLAEHKQPELVGLKIQGAIDGSLRYEKAARNVVTNEAQLSRERSAGVEAGRAA